MRRGWGSGRAISDAGGGLDVGDDVRVAPKSAR